MRRKSDYTDYDKALQLLQRFCAYQDRCHQEARERLGELGVYGDRREQIIAELINEQYLDEERFARSFARGKFKMNRWGRQRIERELQQRNISPYCIKKGLSEIDETEYLQTLSTEAQRRNALEKDAHHPYLHRRKLADYLVKRGFENALVWQTLDLLGIGQND